jgi:hypothetical protein
VPQTRPNEAPNRVSVPVDWGSPIIASWVYLAHGQRCPMAVHLNQAARRLEARQWLDGSTR